MRVGIYNVTTTLKKGGLETFCLELGRHLSQAGDGVVWVAGDNPDFRPPLDNPAALRTFGFLDRRKIIGLGSRVPKLIERLTFFRQARSFLLQAGFDLLIIVKPFDFIPARWLKGRQALRVVFASGGRDFFRGDRRFAGAVDVLTAPSRFNAAQIEARYRRSVEVIPYGVDEGLFRPPDSEAGPRGKGPPILLTVGRLVGWKGLQTVMEALSLVLAGGRPVHWLIAGEGPYRPQLEAMARARSLEEHVTFLGPVEHDRLPEVFARADLFLQPSIGDEAFGITIIEALACGLPVIGSRVGGIPELVVPGQTGELVEPGAVGAWARAIASLLDRPEERRRLGRLARQRVEADYTWTRAAAAYRNLAVS